MKKFLIIFFSAGSILFLLGAVVNEAMQKNTVADWSDMIGRYYEARQLPPIPAPVSYERVVEMMSEGEWDFLTDPNWIYCHEGGTLYLDEKSLLNKKLILPLKLFIQEDLMRGSVVIYAAPLDSDNYSGMALCKAPDFLPYEEGWPKDQYLMDELWPRRVTVTFILRAESERIQDILSFSQEEDETLSAPMMMTLSAPETVDELTLGMDGSNLNVYVPEGFTNRVEIYSTTDLISNVWTIAEQGLTPTSTIPVAWTPSFMTPHAFFRAGNMDIDSDDDGAPDARELMVLKTNPSVPDTDGDEMPDGWEVANGLDPLTADDQIADPDHDMLPNVYEWSCGLNPNSIDSHLVEKIRVDPFNATASNTYPTIRAALNASAAYSVIEIAGGVYDESNITFPVHPVMLMSEQWGTNRSVKINSHGLAAFFLSNYQDNRTIIRGLNINLLGRPTRQFGFYLGRGHTTFTGASPFFDGVKVQLGTGAWSAGFYGLGSTEGTVRFNNCIVRGSGTDNTLSGIYLVDSPNVQVANCSFLEFNTSPELSQGILLGTSPINLGHAASSINAQISNCFWDDSFGANNNYAVVHAVDSSSRYQTTVSHSVVPDSSCLLDVDNEVSIVEVSGTALLDGLIHSNSACRNVSGTDLLSWYDFHGQPRDSTPDIGADEYSAITTTDTDHDGINDYEEAFTYETFIFDYDSDGDRVGDGDEINCGTDPKSRTNYCVSIMGTVDDQTGLNASVKASFSLGSSAWNSSNAMSVSGGQFSFLHQEINSANRILVQVLIDLNGNGTSDSGEPYYTQPLTITNHTSGISFVLSDADEDGVSDYDENVCGTDPNSSANYCVTLQGSVTNQVDLPGTMYAVAVLREETLPPSPWDMDDEGYVSMTLGQIEVPTNGSFTLDHVLVEPNTNGLSRLWLVVYRDIPETNGVLDFYEPISQVLVTPTNHTMSYMLDAPDSTYDTDDDGIPDWWENSFGLSNSNMVDSFEDPDGDWINNLWEYRVGTDPYTYDTNNYAFADAMQAVDSRIADKNPTNAIYIFNEDCYETTNFIRNTNCWAVDIDLTCCSPWNNQQGNKRAGTLVSPRHALFATHFTPAVDKTFYFVDATNGIHTATIQSVHDFGYDLTLAVFYADVSTNISFAKVLPDDYTNYLGHANIHIPGLCLDQEEKALVHDLKNYLLHESMSSCSFSIPVYGARTNYYDVNEGDPLYPLGIKGGDSGNPGFIILNDELVLLTTWQNGGGGSGPSLTSFLKSEVNDIMNLTGYSLTEIDLGTNGLNYAVIPEAWR